MAAPVAVLARAVQRQKEKVPQVHAPDVSFGGVHEGISNFKDTRNIGSNARRIMGAVH